MADSIYTKLLSIRKEVSFEKVRKSGLSYKVLDGDTVLEMVGNALYKRNIVFIPSITGAEITYVEIKSKMVQHALATIDLIFIDADTGETFTVMTHGSGQSYEGKALGIAQTYGIKYFFYRMFLKGESDVDDEASESPSSELDTVVWTRNEEGEVNLFVNFAVKAWEEMGVPTKSTSHAFNRLAQVLGLPSVAGKRAAFVAAMLEYKGSKDNAANAVRGYTETNES